MSATCGTRAADEAGARVDASAGSAAHEVDRWHVRSAGAVAACGLGNILGVTTVVNGTFSAFLAPVSESLHWSRAQFSFGLTILSIVGVACYPLAGRLMDRIGRRPVALVGNVLFGASIMALGLMPNRPGLGYLLFVLVGATATLPSTVLFGRVASTWFERRRGLALGLSGGMAFGIGGMILPGLAQALIDGQGWRAAYLWLGLIVVVIGLPVFWFLLREAPEPSKAIAAPGRALLGDNLRPEAARRQPSFWLMFAAVALGAGSIAAIITHMTPIVIGAGLPAATGPLALGGLFFANAVWQVGIGVLLDRSTSPRRAGVFVLSAVAGALLLAFAGAPAWIMAGALLVGCGCGTEYGLLPFCIPRYYGLRFYGEIYGWIFGAIMLIQGLAPFLMDLIYDQTGSYRPSLIAIAVILTACAALVLRLPGYRFGGSEAEVSGGDAGASAEGASALRQVGAAR